MVKTEHLSRDIAIQTVYQHYLNKIPLDISENDYIEYITELYLKENYEDYKEDIIYIFRFLNSDNFEQTVSFSKELLHRLSENITDYETFLTQNDQTRSIDRFDLPVLSVMLIAMTEIEYNKTDFRIFINEALEFCKIYSDEKSKGYVNKVLQSFCDYKGL